MRVYLASPLGFSESGVAFLRSDLLPLLVGLKLEVLDPWAAIRDKPWSEVVAGFAQLSGNDNARLAQLNAEAINSADCLLAVLDGVDVDSGTASEIGFAYAKGKRIFGYLGDVRVSKDNTNALVNLQVEWFIRASHGSIATSLKDLKEMLQSLLLDAPPSH
jgi:nucleoside 2-deoxyribosyltransferase